MEVSTLPHKSQLQRLREIQSKHTASPPQTLQPQTSQPQTFKTLPPQTFKTLQPQTFSQPLQSRLQPRPLQTLQTQLQSSRFQVWVPSELASSASSITRTTSAPLVVPASPASQPQTLSQPVSPQSAQPQTAGHVAERLRQLKSDLQLAQRCQLQLPSALNRRLRRLKSLSSLNWRTSLPSPVVSSHAPVSERNSNSLQLALEREVRRPLEQLEAALGAVRSEQRAMRRLQEQQLQRMDQLLEAPQASAGDAALVEHVLYAQSARREEFLHAELRHLDQEEKELEQANLELKRQAEAIEAEVPLVSHPPPAWLPMPTLAPTLGISDPSGCRTLPSSGTSPRPLLVPTAGTSTWQSPLAARLTTPTGTSTWQSPVAQPRPATRSEPVAARPGAADAKAASDEVRAVPGQGPLWQPASQDCHEPLMQAYLAFLNNEVDRPPSAPPTTLTPATVACPSPASASPVASAAVASAQGLEMPQVYRAAVQIVAEHGWEALHGGEQAGACWTALHWAAAEGRSDICQLLLRCRANIHHEDEIGRTPAYYAGLHGHAEILALLKTNEPSAAQDSKTPSEEDHTDRLSAASTGASALWNDRASHASPWSATTQHV
ncbi:unnamed protein product [Effrenium voratum]|uniref:Uncharacterized protein n=1 Tax=Effrenium voratum TaxID=2562239 RepID=A0AA36MPB8_9DINO|nr:unnamed protein product [Effrenium voratum]CAJ1424766.1 unnamed protein product [Effrenium voratum]